jgi:hypothetical protein
LTRFPLFFPEKRAFFLENVSAGEKGGHSRRNKWAPVLKRA